MKKRSELTRTVTDLEETSSNQSANEHFSTVLNARLSRRSLLRGGRRRRHGAAGNPSFARRMRR